MFSNVSERVINIHPICNEAWGKDIRTAQEGNDLFKIRRVERRPMNYDVFHDSYTSRRILLTVYCLIVRVDDATESCLMAAVDRINRKHGQHIIRSLAMGFRQDWQMKRTRLSPRYTTHINEMPKVTAY